MHRDGVLANGGIKKRNYTIHVNCMILNWIHMYNRENTFHEYDVP